MKTENVKTEERKPSEEELIDLKVDDEQGAEMKGGSVTQTVTRAIVTGRSGGWNS